MYVLMYVHLHFCLSLVRYVNRQSKRQWHIFLSCEPLPYFPLWLDVRSTNRIKVVSLVDNWGRLNTKDKILKSSLSPRNRTRYRSKNAAFHKVNKLNKPNNNYFCGYGTLSVHINLYVRKYYGNINETIIYVNFWLAKSDKLELAHSDTVSILLPNVLNGGRIMSGKAWRGTNMSSNFNYKISTMRNRDCQHFHGRRKSQINETLVWQRTTKSRKSILLIMATKNNFMNIIIYYMYTISFWVQVILT